MEDWQKNLTEMLEAVSEEVEKFFGDVTEAVDAIAILSEEVSHQVHNVIITEIDQFFNELVQPVIEVYYEFEQLSFEPEWPLTDSVEPSPQQHPACAGCRHYHGQVYSGNLLVCGMHPYGWDSENCPDWEGFN
jgi:GAF domain-containing protein